MPTTTRTRMTPAAIEEMIERRLAEALEAYEAKRNLIPMMESGDERVYNWRRWHSTGAVKIFNEIQRRKLYVGVAAIPKTVDNDVGIIDRSFGFQTAVEKAQQAINAAHVEAESAPNGIGLVKLMGRSTGHIALGATLSSRDVDCCLIPENEFYLEGKGGLFEFLDGRLKQNGHAVVVVAEGAGQDIIPRTDAQKQERDESGNPVFLDVGVWLKSELKSWWDRDHKAGPINGNYAYIPMDEIAVTKNQVDTKDHNWAWVRSVTTQPDFQRNGTAT
nr:ATP-dependent 6-phosphofructokinase 2 [Tanacetum cinerariifolium]